MHAIESELIKATSYKARKKFDNRQDYLGSIMNAVMKLSNDEYDELTDEAATWMDAAVTAHNGKGEIPDFDEVEDDPDADAEAEDADEVSPEEETAEADETSDDPESEDEDDPSEEDGDSDEDDETPEPNEIEAEDIAAAKAAKPKKAAKKVAEPKKEKIKLSVPLKKQGPHDKRVDRDEDVVLDKYGCMEGSKNSDALKMFEKGATAKEIKEKLGGTYYNILKKQQKLGHLIEKEGSIIKLTHRDAAGGKKTIVKKPKK